METNGVAEVAADMAFRLWKAGHGGSDPTSSDRVEFLELVAACAKALGAKHGKAATVWDAL